MHGKNPEKIKQYLLKLQKKKRMNKYQELDRALGQ